MLVVIRGQKGATRVDEKGEVSPGNVSASNASGVVGEESIVVEEKTGSSGLAT